VRVTALMVIFLVSIMVYTPALADIFVYIDKEGVMHFSNAPTHNRYRVYMKENSRSPAPIVNSLKPDTDRYDHLIAESCRLHGVDFALVKAVIRAESCFDPYAISSKVANPFDPQENIRGGVKHLKYLLGRFNYDLKLSLAAYNAGETTVAQVNGIPNYRETKNYVAEVMRYYQEYQKQSPTSKLATQ
jgi:soluble lytic murein transglycosylase-like protein